MPKVSVNAPKTPVTEGSSGIAAATLPNVCKMPGPPAPFVPTPLPNIGKSGTDPKNYSKSVTIGGKKVAIRGATFGSMGDVASKGTGGGLVSANVEGPTSFVGPGSMDTKIEGKNVQLLGDPMLNNCGPGGGPANAATLLGVLQSTGLFTYLTGKDECPLCHKAHGSETELPETPDTKASAQRLAQHLVTNQYAKILMLIMQDKGRPAGITEQWFHKKEKPTAGEVQYYDNSEDRMELTRSPFDHGTTVPPCDTCDLLVPMMLCPDDVPMKCEH